VRALDIPTLPRTFQIGLDDLDLLCFNAKPFADSNTFNDRCEALANYYQRHGNYDGVLTGLEMMSAQRTNGDYLTSVCLQLIQRSFYQQANLVFQPGIIHEDNAYTFAAMIKAKRVGYEDHAYFQRRIRSNSITTKSTTFRNVYGYYTCYKDMTQKFYEANLKPDDHTIPLEIISSVLDNVRKLYMGITEVEKHTYLDWPLAEQLKFKHLIDDFASSKIKLRDSFAEKSILNAKLQKAYTEKSQLNVKLQKTYAEKSELNAELQKTYTEKSELNAQLVTLNRLKFVRMSKWLKRRLNR